jgi:hypothetical protein
MILGPAAGKGHDLALTEESRLARKLIRHRRLARRTYLRSHFFFGFGFGFGLEPGFGFGIGFDFFVPFISPPSR